MHEYFCVKVTIGSAVFVFIYLLTKLWDSIQYRNVLSVTASRRELSQTAGQFLK